MKLDWLKQISKICCDELIAECQQSTTDKRAPQAPLSLVGLKSDKCMASKEPTNFENHSILSQMQIQQAAYTKEVQKAVRLISDMDAAAHRLKTVKAEVKALYDDLVGVCSDVVDHEAATDEAVDNVLGALHGAVDEMRASTL